MAHEARIEIRLSGQDMAPGSIRSREIAEIIDAVEDMIASIVVRDHPELKKETIVIGLVNIRDESIGLQFSANLQELTLPATSRITKSISEENFGALPGSTITCLRKISDFTRKHQCDAEFYIQNGSRNLEAIITPETKIPDVYPLQGETVLYGEITRVGGTDPKIQFKTIDDQLVYCSTTKSLAQQAGTRLYTQVGLRGVAEWNIESLKIENFNVTEILDYEQAPLPTVFAELFEIAGESFDTIPDVNRFVSEIRYGNTEI
jgi:hypothetical protein